MLRSGSNYNVAGGRNAILRPSPSPALPMVANPDDPRIYWTSRWVEILKQADSYMELGAPELAEKQYLQIVTNIRTTQGPTSDAMAITYDHLARLYLDDGKPDEAYRYSEKALGIWRGIATTREKALAGVQPAKAASADVLGGARLAIVDLLTRLGRLDEVSSNLARARGELQEANRLGIASVGAIVDHTGHLGSLDSDVLLVPAP